MRLQKRQKKVNLAVNLAPMIDIILLLIIFLMMVTQITRFDLEPLTLPEAVKGESQPPQAEIVIVNIQATDRIIIDQRIYQSSQIPEFLSKKISELGQENVSVLIRGDFKSSWEVSREIMAQCAKLGISDVEVAVTPKVSTLEMMTP